MAHLTPAFFATRSVVGGGERYVVNVAQSVRRAAHSSSRRFSQAIFACGECDETFDRDGIPVRVMRNDNIVPSVMDATVEPLWRELERFDLVHIHQSLTVFGVYCTVVAKSLGKRLVLTDLGGGQHNLMTTGRGMQLADGVVSISSYAHSLIASSFSGPHEIVIGPVDTDLFSPAPGRPRSARRVICVSRILPHKGIDRIIAALPRGLSLKIVGQIYHHAYYDKLRGMAEGKDVEFIHDADDTRLVALYRASDVFAQASTTRDCYGQAVSKSELMGLTTLEAMSCGLPVIVSNTGSLPELVRDERFGRVFSTHEELVGMFEDVLAGLWPPPNAAALAWAYVVEQYAFGVVGARLGEFYARIDQSGGACVS